MNLLTVAKTVVAVGGLVGSVLGVKDSAESLKELITENKTPKDKKTSKK